jgi:hypothetical protein
MLAMRDRHCPDQNEIAIFAFSVTAKNSSHDALLTSFLRGGALRMLGLISFLKEERNCKVTLILNDEELSEDKVKFDKNLEKVVDVSLVYEPTSSEVLAIAIPDKDTDANSRLIAERCGALGISNIRVIKRVRRFVEQLAPMVKDFDPGVFYVALASLSQRAR